MKVFTITPIKIFKFENGSLSRNISRIESHILSLKNQKTSADITSIISDMSEDKDIINKLSEICRKNNVTYVNTKSNLIFNKSLCLNIGIKMAEKADYIATIDADILLRNDVIQKCIDNKRKGNVILCQTFMYNSSVWHKDFDEKSFNSVKEDGSLLSKSGNGGIQFFSKDWLYKVNGYDERYNLRGGMDNEIIKRFLLDNGNQNWLNLGEEILLVHLDHKRYNFLGITKEYTSDYRIKNNVMLYNILRSQRRQNSNLNDHIIVNKKSWGVEKNVVGPRMINGNVIIK
jgi:predicted glycosyltransferase involved in capsule biosynthesis